MVDDSAPRSDETLNELEYYTRLQPAREEPYEAGVSLLASAGIVCALASLWFKPFILGMIAIAVSIVALAFSASNMRHAKLALILSTVCWLVGGLIAITLDRDVW